MNETLGFGSRCLAGRPWRRTLGIVALALLSQTGCGGGSDYNPPPTPDKITVSKVTVGTPKYGQPLLFTVDGSLLDATLTVAVTASACTGLQRSTTAPNVSSATQAFYTCTVASTGDSSFSITDPKQAGALGTAAFTVPLPQVSLTVGNGLGVSGVLVFTLEPNKVKLTVDNFLQYVNDGFYVGTVFHRVLPGFVVQGGGYLPLTPGTTPSAKTTRAAIALEVGAGLSNTVNTLAMARAAAANSATSQFFVNLANNSGSLDPGAATAGYAVFGALASGQDVLTALVGAPCAPFTGLSECAPNPNVVISAAAQTR